MTVDVVTGELVPFSGGTLTPEQAHERALWVREVTKAALTEGVDYGHIPGTDKPTLLKPGAEMLLLAAGLGFTMTKRDDADARAHHGVTYTCAVMRGAFTVAECDGYAGYDESRFYTSAEDAERRERGNAAQYERNANPARFVEYRAPWNTLVKMAQKRALVGATLNATAASGLFIADLDDDVPPPTGEQQGGAAGRKRGRRASTGADATGTPAPPPPAPVPAELAAGIAELTDRLNKITNEGRKGFHAWLRSAGLELPPTSAEALRKMLGELSAIEGREAEARETYGGAAHD